MNSRSEQIQILYEIVTSIDTELDLQDMLKKCLSIYVRKLNCSAGAVFKLNQYSQGENYYFKEIVSIPRRVHNNPAYKDAIKQIPQEPNKQTLNEFYKHLPISLHISENQHCHIMNLPGFGLITFLKGGEPLKVDLLNSLLALNNEIAYACKSCLNVEALIESEEKYRLLAENTLDCIWQMGIDFKFTYVNPSVLQMLGFTQEEWIGSSLSDYCSPENMEFMVDLAKEEIKKGSKSAGVKLETYLFHKNNREIPIEITAKILFDKDEYPVGLQGTTRDITERKQAEEKLQETYQRLKKTMDASIETMSKILEAKDPYTAGHQQRVSQLAIAIAKELNLSQDKIEGIRIASLIHDIGKIGLPTEILSKPTKLSDMEFDLIKGHSQIGYDILKSIDFSWPIAQIVLQHHEKVNGSGYPGGLKGDEILLEAKIICVADVVEAMSSHRPYRPALGIDKALEEISQNKGILYDPKVVDTCIKLFKEKGFKF